MNPGMPEKTERVSKRGKGNEPYRVPSISLQEGSGRSEKFAAHPATGTGSMRAHNRGTSPNLHLIYPSDVELSPHVADQRIGVDKWRPTSNSYM